MKYLTLFLEFFKMGLFTFGGGYAMIPLIEETVLKYGWLTEARFSEMLGVCESTPGPVAINMATYIGSVQGGLLGSIVATLGVVLPSFIIILLIAAVLKNFTDHPFFKGFVRGVQPVVIGLILSTGVILFVKALGYVSLTEFRPDWISVIIFGLLIGIYWLALKVFKKKLSAIQLILISAGLGLAVCSFHTVWA